MALFKRKNKNQELLKTFDGRQVKYVTRRTKKDDSYESVIAPPDSELNTSLRGYLKYHLCHINFLFVMWKLCVNISCLFYSGPLICVVPILF